MKTFLYLVFLLFISLINLLRADVRFVSKSGASVPPFLSWTTAADSIQKCLDICDNGDTVYVGNGVYHESLIINKELTLMGLGMDSTIIDGTDLLDLTINIPSTTPVFNVKNFNIIGQGPSGVAVFCLGLLNMSNCKISHAQQGIFHKGGNVNNLFIHDVQTGIGGGCPYDTCHYTIDNNIITLNSEWAVGINGLMGGYYFVRNNIVIYHEGYYSSNVGIKGSPHYIKATNNLVSGFIDGFYITVIDTAFLTNNIVTNTQTAFNLTNRSVVKNSIIFNNDLGISSRSPIGTPRPVSDYNIFWNNIKNYESGYTIPGDSDRVSFPMLVKDTEPDSTLVFDFHLQKYSPCIDKGDLSILDLDGTRSDIGLYGGNWGETYEYKDLAPMAPKNFTATVTSGQILFKWKKNAEADTAYYSIYMDSTQNFTIDSTKLVTTTADTLFNYLSPQVNKPLYFKITATDKQGNQSLPSEELYIFINVTGEEYPKEISSYQLYNNYPNPFNPSTTISYKLKERGYVKLLVYDLKGELIKVLVNQEQAAGYYETEFNASGLASGIYIYRIEVIGKGSIPVYSDMKKCIILK